MARPVAEHGGFTLVELLVALVLSGIVVGSIFQLLVGQGQFVELQSAREEVQQNTRAAIELISSELRTLPAGDALVYAGADSITLRVVRAWGVVCDTPAPNALDVVFPSIAGMSYTPNLGTGVAVNLGDIADEDWSSAVRVESVGSAAATCAAEALGSGVERRTLALSGTPQNSDGDTPADGNILYLYDQVTYRIGTSPMLPGLWIQRRVGQGSGSSNQPFAGPVLDGGLSFQYFADGSSTPLATPLGSAARASVARVAVVVESVSRNSQGEFRESKADTVIVALRNRSF